MSEPKTNREIAEERARFMCRRCRGHMIAVIRDSMRLSQADLGKQLGISHAAISDIERGKTSIRLEQLERLASILRLNPKDLL